jgi:hypothetical protein
LILYAPICKPLKRDAELSYTTVFDFNLGVQPGYATISRPVADEMFSIATSLKASLAMAVELPGGISFS